MKQSERLGQEAGKNARKSIVNEFARTMVTPAGQIPGAEALAPMGDLWNALKLVNPDLPEPPTEQDLQAVSEEFIMKRTVRGKAFNMNDPMQKQLYESLDKKVPNEKQCNTLCSVARGSVTDATGDLEFLGGLKLGNLLNVLIEGLIDYFANGCKGSLMASFKKVGFATTRAEACQNAKEDVDFYVKNGTLTREMADKFVPGLHEGMTEEARKKGIDVGPAKAAPVPIAQLIAAHKPMGAPGSTTGVTTLTPDDVKGKPPAEALPMVFSDVANKTISALGPVAESPEFKPGLDAAKKTFAKVGTELASRPDADLNNKEKFADEVLKKTILDLAKDPAAAALLDASKLDQVKPTDSWETALTTLSRDPSKTGPLKAMVLDPLRANLVNSNPSIQAAAGKRASLKPEEIAAQEAKQREEAIKAVTAARAKAKAEITSTLSTIKVDAGEIRGTLDRMVAGKIEEEFSSNPEHLKHHKVPKLAALTNRLGKTMGIIGDNSAARKLSDGKIPSPDDRGKLVDFMVEQGPKCIEHTLHSIVDSGAAYDPAKAKDMCKAEFIRRFDAGINDGSIPRVWAQHKDAVTAAYMEKVNAGLDEPKTKEKLEQIKSLPKMPTAPVPAVTDRMAEVLSRSGGLTGPAPVVAPPLPDAGAMVERAETYAGLHGTPGGTIPAGPARFDPGLVGAPRVTEVRPAGVGTVPGRH